MCSENTRFLFYILFISFDIYYKMSNVKYSVIIMIIAKIFIVADYIDFRQLFNCLI